MDEPEEPIKLALVDSLGKIVSDIYQGLKGLAKDQKAAVLNDAAAGFAKLMRETYARRSKIKTIVDPDISVDLRQIFVAPHLTRESKLITFDHLVEGLQPGARVVVSGTAGAGKSLLLKAALLQIIEFWQTPIPIFVELRALNGRTEEPEPLKNLIVETVSSYVRGFDQNRLEHGLFHGKFMLLLDALDEVDHGIRPRVIKEILRFSERNRQTIIVVSSRPDDIFSSWEEFQVCHVKGLSKSESAQVVKNLPYKNIEDLKPSFLVEIIEKQFETHREFLSVPLLLVMMLLVYRSFAEVPDKVINFYKRAFDTLFQGHDSMKSESGGKPYKRRTQSDLALEDFTKTFAAFCAASYIDRKISLTEDEALDLARRAITSSDVIAKPEPFLADLQQSVCVLQRDGTELSFVHRSFQEYFAATYLTRCDWSEERRLIALKRVGRKLARDNVASMMRELDVGVFENRWLLPALSHLIVMLEPPPGEDAAAHITHTLLGSFQCRFIGEGLYSAGWDISPVGEIWEFIGSAVPDSRLHGLHPTAFFQLGSEVDLAKKFGVATDITKISTTEEEWTLSCPVKLSDPLRQFFSASRTGRRLRRDAARLPKVKKVIEESVSARREREFDLFGGGS